jgi:hypothetical protein
VLEDKPGSGFGEGPKQTLDSGWHAEAITLWLLICGD